MPKAKTKPPKTGTTEKSPRSKMMRSLGQSQKDVRQGADTDEKVSDFNIQPLHLDGVEDDGKIPGSSSQRKLTS